METDAVQSCLHCISHAPGVVNMQGIIRFVLSDLDQNQGSNNISEASFQRTKLCIPIPFGTHQKISNK
eukprot:1972760-Amphidinium_carterae.1